MARVILAVRIMPQDSDIDLDALSGELREKLPQDFKLLSVSREAVAFGLESLVVWFSVPEEEGVTERLESYLSAISGVGEFNVEAISRASE
ncbi:MAG: elongation factor 1-beta [Nitrososphaerota archaeon]|nr:elongation factor 1-beta [Candidatus Calditenuaceae archaeon]MDW8073634.1 elongation factor 1-beta [Nitrososphaerota archaeon]